MRLAFLWHLHQPDYRDPDTGVPVMPWVRMHALRGYRDLPLDVLEHGVAATINVVPSLLDQLLAYEHGISDRHLDLTTRPADALGPNEIEEIRGTFVAGHPTMIEIHEPYRRLAGRVRDGAPLDRGALRDLQVWSTLAWFGSTALRDYPELRDLRHKGAGFSEDDKATMLRAQRRIVSEIIGIFGRVARSGTAAISTSPYFHPILPLLVDNRHAQRCMPGVPDDARFSSPDDALLQLSRARERVRELFGAEVHGLWPSEGSVSPEVVELAAQAGYRWLATDEGILHRSDGDTATRPGGWDVGHGVRAFFRDRDLSDRIGFDYARRDPHDAARDLLGAAAHRARDGVLTIALDGENPWEAFPDAGAAFRRELHRGLVEGPVRGITFDEAATHEPVGRIRRLHTGSWINADFGIWFGHAEDRRAWRLLDECRRAIEAAPLEARAAALEKLLPAEGSDWMWWYGEEFSTPFAPTFDRLFRAHVRSAWVALGRQPPAELDRPVTLRERVGIDPPRGLIAPTLVPDPSWIRWAPAGHAAFGRGSSMARGALHTLGLRFGWSRAEAGPRGALWLRVELESPAPEEAPGTSWRVQAGDLVLELPYAQSGARAQTSGVAGVVGPGSLVVSFDGDRLPEGPVPVRVSVVRGADVVAAYPPDGALTLPGPGVDWHV